MLKDVFVVNSNQYISANTLICHLYITSIDALSSFEFNPPYSPISQTSLYSYPVSPNNSGWQISTSYQALQRLP